MADADPLPRARPGGLRGRRPRLVITDAVRDGHLAFFVKREVQAEVLALQNGENPQALLAVVIAMFLGVGIAAFFVFGLALAATWVLVCMAMLAVTLGGADGLQAFGILMYMLAVFLWGNVKLFMAGSGPSARRCRTTCSTKAPRRDRRPAARRTTRSSSSMIMKASASTSRSRSASINSLLG